MMAYFGATLRPGIEIVIEATKLRQRLAGADLCITGEGRLDAQSLHGKTILGVAHLCRELGVPCVAIAGSIGDGMESLREHGISSCIAIQSEGMPVEESMRDAARLLEDAAATHLGARKFK